MSEKVEIRTPDTIHLLKSDLDRLAVEFTAKLIELIKRQGVAGAEMRPKVKTIYIGESVEVSVE